MSNGSKHKKDVAGISDMQELAAMIGDLHYETLTELLTHLYIKIYDDGAKDRIAGRARLGQELQIAAMHLSSARTSMNEAWHISKPFMEPVPLINEGSKLEGEKEPESVERAFAMQVIDYMHEYGYARTNHMEWTDGNARMTALGIVNMFEATASVRAENEGLAVLPDPPTDKAHKDVPDTHVGEIPQQADKQADKEGQEGERNQVYRPHGYEDKEMARIGEHYVPCRCDEIYTSRNLTAPDCPYHTTDVEEAMIEWAHHRTASLQSELAASRKEAQKYRKALEDIVINASEGRSYVELAAAEALAKYPQQTVKP